MEKLIQIKILKLDEVAKHTSWTFLSLDSQKQLNTLKEFQSKSGPKLSRISDVIEDQYIILQMHFDTPHAQTLMRSFSESSILDAFEYTFLGDQVMEETIPMIKINMSSRKFWTTKGFIETGQVFKTMTEIMTAGLLDTEKFLRYYSNNNCLTKDLKSMAAFESFATLTAKYPKLLSNQKAGIQYDPGYISANRLQTIKRKQERLFKHIESGIKNFSGFN